MTSGALRLADVKETVTNEAEIVDWQQSLRSAIYDAINESDVKEIVENQVKKAKEGDSNAIKFVFGHVLGTSRNITMNQTNVITDVETAARIEKQKRA